MAHVHIIFFTYSCILSFNISFSYIAFYQTAEVEQDKSKPNHLVVALSSDRGLCGGIHSSVAKYIRFMVEEEANADTKLIIVGDKAKAILSRYLN